jgi:orotate phosphoribosyltransferase
MDSTELRTRLLALLRERAFREGDFTLASGQKSNYYIDGRMIAVCPEGAYLIGEALVDLLKDVDCNVVGGLAVGAVPIVTATMVACYRHGRPMEGIWVREKAKDHGMQKQIEGKLPENPRVVIVDDVITSGGSSLKAAEAVEAAGGKVVLMAAIVDRQQGAAELFASRGYEYRPLFIKDDLFQKK